VSEQAARTRDDLLDELADLATIEHSLCVEYLSVHCALGHDLAPVEGDAEGKHVAQAAQAAFAAAFSEMRHVHEVNRVLVRAGRSPALERAPSIRPDSGSEIALGPVTIAQLERVVERERALASAVDERYATLRRAVESSPVLFEPDLQSEFTSVLSPDPDHSQLPAALEQELDEIPPSRYLRAIPRPVSGDLERTLLDLSNHCYRLVVAMLRIWFEHEDEILDARDQATGTMTALNTVNGFAVQRGLLPPFTAP
jgi:hypothetical protein